MKKEFWDKMFQMLGEISDEERQKSLDEHDEGRLVVTCHYYMPNRRTVERTNYEIKSNVMNWIY